MTSLSVVIPIKDERDNLGPLRDQNCCHALEPLRTGQAAPALADYELLFIDDGSNDGSFAVREELAASDPRRQGGARCAVTSARRRRCRPASIRPPATC